MATRPEVFTVGHSTHGLERLLGLLTAHRIDLLADVRRFPASRRNPQFNAERLAAALAERGIGYEPLGESLGGRRPVRPGSSNDGWRVPGFRGYADHMESAEFQGGLERLEKLATGRRAAFMCAESDWRRCHRRLIADALTARGWSVAHIRPDSSLEAHELPSFAVVAGGRVTYPAHRTLDS